MSESPATRSFLRVFLLYWLPVFLYITVIAVLSAQPNLTPPAQFHVTDKFYHALEYFGLGVLLSRGFRSGRRAAIPMRTVLMTITLGIIVGTCDEIFQSFIPGRMSDIYDVLADTTGVLLSQVAYLLAVRE